MESATPGYRCVVGIDVAAASVTVVCQVGMATASAPLTVAQTARGFQSLMHHLQRLHPDPATTLIVMEATGSYWIALATTLHEAGYHISVINPAHAHHFARSRGQRAKTDQVDARMLCVLGRERTPPRWTPPPAIYHELRQRLMARDLLLTMRTQTLNHRHAVDQWPVVVASVRTHLTTTIATFDEQISTLTAEIDGLLTDGSWATSATLLADIPGLGTITIAWLLVTTLNFQIAVTAQQLTAYAGLAPMPRQSGTSIRGRPAIGHSGNGRLRSALYMATLSATRYNPTIKRFYDRLREAGKPSKVARCAAARKLLHLARAVVVHERPFDPNYVV